MKFLEFHGLPFAKTILFTLGLIVLLVDVYNLTLGEDITISTWCFFGITLASSLALHLIDGHFISGSLKKRVEIGHFEDETKVAIEFGDIFQRSGWKAIAVNDFFDRIVDEDLVSSKSLHGITLSRFWGNKADDWQIQINSSLTDKEFTAETRSKGNKKRYPIGTTASAVLDENKFLFVALGKTNISNNVTNASAESLIRAVHGLLAVARAKCSLEPLAIPLMGSGLGRVGIKNSVLVDLILTAIYEESRVGKVTSEITLVLPLGKKREINLKNFERSWRLYG